MIRGQPREMNEHDDEAERARQIVVQNIVLFSLTVAALRIAPYVIDLF